MNMKYGYIGHYPGGGPMYNIGGTKAPCITGQAGWEEFCKILDERLKKYINEIDKDMENNKYYTPDIEEFHVGFECEFKNDMQDNVWKTEICDPDIMSIFYDSIEHDENFNDVFRVKYLDREDIESLGFKYLGYDKDGRTHEVYDYKGEMEWWLKDYRCWNDDNDIVIHKTIKDGVWRRDNMFKGVIKNKSELKQILKQLGISET